MMETAKQAQADMDRLQGKRRQELKEAQDKLELALSDNHVAGEQLVAMQSLLSQRDDEHELTLKKSQILESESMSLKNTLEEMVQNLETERIMTKQARADQVKEVDSCSTYIQTMKLSLHIKKSWNHSNKFKYFLSIKGVQSDAASLCTCINIFSLL